MKGPTKDSIQHLSRYFKERVFGSEGEARRAVWNIKARERAQHLPWALATDSEVKAYAAAFPVYKLKKGWKIGVPVRDKPKRLRWADLTIEPNDVGTLTTLGYINYADAPRLGPIKFVKLDKIRRTEAEQDHQFIEKRAAALKAGTRTSFKAIVLDGNAIRDGHHRWWIAKSLYMRTVPAQEIIYPA